MRVFKDIRWGIPQGLRIAQGFFLFVAVPYVLLGDRWLAHLGVTFWGIIVAYFGIGIVAGVILGVLRPIIRQRQGAIITGIIIAWLGFGGTFALASKPPSSWSVGNWVGVIAAGVLAGAFGGNLVWKEGFDRGVGPTSVSQGAEPSPKFRFWKP